MDRRTLRRPTGNSGFPWVNSSDRATVKQSTQRSKGAFHEAYIHRSSNSDGLGSKRSNRACGLFRPENGGSASRISNDARADTAEVTEREGVRERKRRQKYRGHLARELHGRRIPVWGGIHSMAQRRHRMGKH